MCSYCGCQSIDVIGRFMAEHEVIINATGVLRRAVESGAADAVASAREGVAALLWPHTGAEETGLFRVMGQQDEFSDHIATLCAEHRTLDGFLAGIAPGDTAAMIEFEIALRDHIHKEDNGLFPAAAIALSGEDWDEVDASTPPAGDQPAANHPHAGHEHASHGHDHHDHDHAHDHASHGHDHHDHAGHHG